MKIRARNHLVSKRNPYEAIPTYEVYAIIGWWKEKDGLVYLAYGGNEKIVWGSTIEAIDLAYSGDETVFWGSKVDLAYDGDKMFCLSSKIDFVEVVDSTIPGEWQEARFPRRHQWKYETYEYMMDMGCYGNFSYAMDIGYYHGPPVLMENPDLFF